MPPAAGAPADLATPHQAPVGLTAIGKPSEYQLFSTDLSLAAVEPEGATPLALQATERTIYLRSIAAGYTPLVTPANVPEGVRFGGTEAAPEAFLGSVTFRDATRDLSHVLVTSPEPLTPDFGPAFEPTENIFEWSGGSLRLVSRLPPAPADFCGRAGPACHPDEVPGAPAEVGLQNSQVRNAISADGSRVIFSTRSSSGRAPLYLRDLVRGETLRLDAAQNVVEPGAAQAQFQSASADGSRIFFTDGNRLTADSTVGSSGNKPDLYMCEVVIEGGHLACDLRDLTANHLNSAEPADAQGLAIGASEDGSDIYFVADGALTTGRRTVSGHCEGGVASSSCNLYHYDLADEETTLVAVLSGLDAPDSGGNEGGAKPRQPHRPRLPEWPLPRLHVPASPHRL